MIKFKNLQKIISNLFEGGDSEKKNNLLSLILILLISIFYLLTINDGRDFSGDTAKFQFAGKILGVIHPPGYPNYLVLNHLFVKIFPFGNLAFKANLLSSIFSILASFFLFRILLFLKIESFTSFLTTIIFSLTFTLWSQSIYAEVYTLNILFFSSTIFFFLKWHLKRDEKFLFLGCFLYALSFGNHLSMITLLPAILYLTLITDKKVFVDFKKILIVFLFILLGASQYFYLFIRSKSSIYAEMPIESFNSFIWFVTGGWFKSKFFSFSIEEILLFSLPRFIYYLFREFLFLAPLPLLGFLKLRKEMKIFFFLALIGNIILGLNYDIGDIYVYYLPSYFVLSVFLGVSFGFFEKKFFQKRIILKAFCGFLLPLIFFSVNYPFIKKLRNYEEDRRSIEILKFVDENSIILTTDYRTYEFLLYFLIGEERFKEKNIHVDFCNSLEEVNLYLCENYPFYSLHFRKSIPEGRRVYFVKSKYSLIFKKSGLKIFNVNDFLYRIECKKRRVERRPFFLVEYSLKDSYSFAFHTNRKIDYKIDFEEDPEKIIIRGKVKIPKIGEGAGKICLVLKSDRISYVFDDMDGDFNDSFLVRIKKREIDKDFYRIAIFVKGKEFESLWFTEKFYGASTPRDIKKHKLRQIKLKYRNKIEKLKEFLSKL